MEDRQSILQFMTKKANFTSPHIVQTVPRAQSDPIQWEPHALTPEKKRLERQADHSPEFNDEFRNE
jgi:hypothetical protein